MPLQGYETFSFGIPRDAAARVSKLNTRFLIHDATVNSVSVVPLPTAFYESGLAAGVFQIQVCYIKNP